MTELKWYSDPTPPDPFDNVSIYKRANDKHGHVHERVKEFQRDNEGDWVVCRFVDRGGERNRFGWPLRWPSRRQASMAPQFDTLGWNEDGQIAFFDQKTAEKTAAEGRQKIAFDRAVRRDQVLWRVLMYSAYDSSTIEMYRGGEYAEACATEAVAMRIAQGNNYLKVIFEGVYELPDNVHVLPPR